MTADWGYEASEGYPNRAGGRASPTHREESGGVFERWLLVNQPLV